jgi:pimeloyl-ACP methyl ester carboxylesterase
LRVPTLFIVGGADVDVLARNREAIARISGPHTLHVVPGATHLFPEPGALDAVVRAAVAYFVEHLV